VDAHRHEVLADEVRDVRIRIHLGIQPSASPSHRRRGEVQQDVTVQLLRALEFRLEPAAPPNLRHFRSFGHSSSSISASHA
jgi:hypothetical protein